MQLPGYEIKETLFHGNNSIVYRGISSGSPVIIKYLNKEYPSPSELNYFQYEYDLLSSINEPFIVKPISIENYQNSLAIIFKDIGGLSLDHIINLNFLKNYQDLLEISIQIAYGIASIHDLQIVHNDIKHQNIIYNIKDKKINIIDFGSATRLKHQNPFNQFNDSIIGTLAHISPEQTGRMNRTVDYRTDIYSYGILIYKLFTGSLPFVFDDPMEMIHAHIAKKPADPQKIFGVPPMISKIILKLLEKIAEDRYQSLNGVIHDFKICLSAYQKGGMEDLEKLDFQIGKEDYSIIFQLPKKIYGRDSEISSIVKAYKFSTMGNLETVLISGESGTGKSVLINEINKSIPEHKGYFVSGKYDLYKKSIPYRGIRLALRDLIRQILVEKSESLDAWRSSILESLGSNARLIIDIIPDLELLIGPQPEVIELEPSESENRFNYTFLNFLKVFCKKNHPLAIFLDDLQWADASSVSLIRTVIFDHNIKFLFLVLSYRDKEILPAGIFHNLVNDFVIEKKNITQINLKPLNNVAIQEMVIDTLLEDNEDNRNLAKLLQSKTKGNPFYISELFKNLYKSGFIFFDGNRWKCNFEKINQTDITDNVIELLVSKMKELSKDKIEILKIAACVGSSFKKDIFLKILGKNWEEVEPLLVDLANEEFFLLGKSEIRFIHDKIHEAVYILLSEDERSRNHHKIGLTYLNHLSENKLDEYIFTIVNQLNQCRDRISDVNDMKRLSELNIIAGYKSLASTAYESAFNFFSLALELCNDNLWESDYQLSLELYSMIGRAAYLSKKYDLAETFFQKTLLNARTVLDRTNIYELMSSLYVSQNKMIDVLNILNEALLLLGYKLPEKPSDFTPLPEILKLKIRLAFKSIEEIEAFPKMQDPCSLSAMRLMNAAIAPSFLARPKLFPILVLKMVNLTLKEGLSPVSSFAFVSFGMIQGFGLGDYQSGYKFGKLGLVLSKHNFARQYQCRTLFMFAAMINHWSNHALEAVPIFIKSYQVGLESGDFQYASYSLNNLHFQGLLRRQNLNELKDSFDTYDSSMISMKQENAYQLFGLNRQTVINLLGEEENLTALDGLYFSEKEELPKWLESSNANALFDYYLCKTRLEYFFGDIFKAYEYSNECLKYESAMFSMMFIPEGIFLQGLIIGKILDFKNGSNSQKELRSRLDYSIKQFSIWGKNSPSNYGHKHKILLGIRHLIDKKYDLSINYFLEAIDLAKEHKYSLEEAIAHELCAEIYSTIGNTLYAQLHIQESCYAYSKWGLKPKVKAMEERYDFLIRNRRMNLSKSHDTKSISYTTNSTFTDKKYLDLNTILKASQAISSEIQLGKLLEKLLAIVFENVGANRGMLIFKDKDDWLIQADGNVIYEKSIQVLQGISIYNQDAYEENRNKSYSINIINFVIRTKELLILNDVENEGMFVNDPYIKQNNSKSILCYPIFNHGDLVGIIYLENSLLPDAFTGERVELLDLLSAQIAISYENSFYFKKLEEKVEERTQNLNKTLNKIKELKENQDMDYYLTSLLLEPLSSNRAISDRLKVEFLLQQKKQFVYKNISSEIGGDISISETLFINGKKYLAVINGDAMGKSLQGAAGALVLGTAFLSLVNRYNEQSVASNLSIDPIHWLLDTYKELQNIFQTFEGSMLITTFLTLIEESGKMIILNCDHPKPIIYRRNKASYVNLKNNFPRLGIRSNQKIMELDYFQLLPNDIFIFGSDGKDDLSSHSNENEILIQRDEDSFLKTVEKSQGDLPSIVANLKEKGDLYDDLSLVKIYFNNL